MARLSNGEGKTIKELAHVYGVSPRTVQRALKANLDEKKREALYREMD